MKKLCSLFVATSLLGGLYGTSIGFGLAYDGMGSESAKPYGMQSYASIRTDVMWPIFPIIGFRAGLIQYDFTKDPQTDQSKQGYKIGTGCYGGLFFTIPLPMAFTPYIPFMIVYEGIKDEPSRLSLKSALGGMMDFGPVDGYLEGGISILNATLEVPPPTVPESKTYNWFYVQGGVRVPIGL